MGHKTVNKIKLILTASSIFYKNKEVIFKVSNRKQSEKSSSIWKINKKLLLKKLESKNLF